MQILVIDRGKWNCGRKKLNPKLLQPHTGMMCCLGFLAYFGLHAKEEDIINVGMPSEVHSVCAWPIKLFGMYTKDEVLSNAIGATVNGFYERLLSWENFFATINDIRTDINHQLIDNDIREAWIKEGFEKILNIDVRFIGEH